jgi:nicotinamidase-related amidase
MQKKALVVIDIQNDITKNYKDIIDNINTAIDWAVDNGIPVAYIRHEALSEKARKFIPGTYGSELVPELKIVSDNVFIKHTGNVLTSEEFIDFVNDNGIKGFYLSGADATQCVKSTCFNMCKAGYGVIVLSDCITSWDKKQIPDMLHYYESKGGKIISLQALLDFSCEPL